MDAAAHKPGSSPVRHVLVALSLAFILTLSAGAESIADQGHFVPNQMPGMNQSGPGYRVTAALGVLDPGMEGVTLWHDYGSFGLYRVTDAALRILPDETLDRATILSDADHLTVGNVEIDTQAPIAEEAARATETDGAGAALHLVQFVGPIKDEWLQAVAATGATPVHYIAIYGYLLWADAESRASLDALAEHGQFLRFSAPYPLPAKAGAEITALGDSNEVVPVVIQMYRHDGRAGSEAAIESVTVEQQSEWTSILAYQNLHATVRAGDIDTILSLPDVFWVGERLERQPLDEVQGQIMAGKLNRHDTGPSGPGYLTWLEDLGFSANPAGYPIVNLTDDGIGTGSVNSGDPTLHESGDSLNPTRLAYVANCTDSADGGSIYGHGHINASIAGGYDASKGPPSLDPLGYQRGLGINPFGRYAGTRVFDPNFDSSACGGTDTSLIQNVQDNGALINSNSWGCRFCPGTYDASSQAYDVGVRDADLTEPGNQELIVLFAAANEGPGPGTVKPPGNGKNMITVGASENDRPSDENGAWTDGCLLGPSDADSAMDVASFSSRGPTPDGRAKPEVIAPGTHIQGTASTHPSYSGSYVCDPYRPWRQRTFAASSGTSHSTPAVAGATSLAYWWLENKLGVTTPSPAMMKAYLIAHPTYLTGVDANDTLPSNNQGYGMPNMRAMFDKTARYLLDQSVLFDSSGEAWTWAGAVDDPALPVRIVLAYTDAAGAIGTSPQVNDLNLGASVGGTTYLGNVFSGQWSTAGGSADPLNNYEAIYLPAGTSGDVEITITGYNIAGDGVPNSGDGTDQDFALVCYNCSLAPSFSVNVNPVSVDVCAPDDAVYSVDIGASLGFSGLVTLSASGNPAGTTVGFSTNPVSPPGSSDLTIGNTGAGSTGSYAIDVSGTSTLGTEVQTVAYNSYSAPPLAPDLLAPASGATNQPFKPEFSWTAAAEAAVYFLEVATDPGLSNVVYSAEETGTSHLSDLPLGPDTEYFWRVTAGNGCGSDNSLTFSFHSQAASLICNGATVEFEGGIPFDWWSIDNSGGTGITWTTTADPACGIPNLTTGFGEAACADSDAAGAGSPPYDTELVSNPFDLSGTGAVSLEVKAYYRDITTGADDRFRIDVWNGTSWTNELNWDEDHEPEDISLNLSAYAGLPTVKVVFHYLGSGFDWYAQVDDVTLTCLPAGPPAIEVEPPGLAISQFPSAVSTRTVTITNSGAGPLDWTILEGSSGCKVPSDVKWLSVAPDTGVTGPLDSALVGIGFDSTGLAPGGYTADLCITSNDPAATLVQVPVTLTVDAPTLLACNGDAVSFEDGIASGWVVVDNTGGSGVVWVTTDDPACSVPNYTNGSGEAACADSDAAGLPAVPYDTELWTNAFDLSSWGSAQVDVKAYYRDISTGANDRFVVDVWDGATWTHELVWDEDHEPADFTIDLATYTGKPNVQLRFRYSGDGHDWYVQVDDVALTCGSPAAPSIQVVPPAFGSAQVPGVEEVIRLTILNAGGSDLDWSVAEDDGPCDSPVDVPWLATAPDAGTTAPGADSSVMVSFDSTGLLPGLNSAHLCLSSNDPALPLVPVPVTLLVQEPFVLTCNGEMAGFETGIPPGWQVSDREGNGVAWTDIGGSGEMGNYTGGGGNAATVSSDRFGPAPFDTTLRTTVINLSGWLPTDSITLNYLANYQTLAGHDFLETDASIDGGLNWTHMLSWNEDHGLFRNAPGEAVEIALSRYAGESDLILRWRYFDPESGRDWDGYAQFDEVALACTPNPVVDVDPTSLSGVRVPGQREAESLNIGNLGNAALDWTMHEDTAVAGGTCEMAAAIAWLGVSSDAGSILPGNHTSVDVTTDATGLVPGPYAAKLCIQSNDPATPLVALPVDVIVNNVPPLLEAAPALQQVEVCEAIAAVTFEAEDSVAEVLEATARWSSDGVSFAPGLPAGLTLGAPVCTDDGAFQRCAWSITGAMCEPAGATTLRVDVEDDYGGEASAAVVLEAMHRVHLPVVLRNVER